LVFWVKSKSNSLTTDFENGRGSVDQRRQRGGLARLVHFTDFSPDRKSPLERTLCTALTEAEANAVVYALIYESIKKEWEEKKGTPTVCSETRTKPSATKVTTKKPSGKARKIKQP